MVRLINMLILILVTLGITVPKETNFSGKLDTDVSPTITEFIESHDDSGDDRPDENEDLKKVDTVEPYFIPNRYDFTLKLASISFIDRLPTLTSSYIPVFHVPPSLGPFTRS